MEGMIVFASVMIILVCAVYLVKNLIIGVTWLIRNIVKDLYKDLDMSMVEEK